MSATKLSKALALALLVQGACAAVNLRHRVHQTASEDIEACQSTADEFLTGSVSGGVAANKAMDYCNKEKGVSDRKYTCQHFGEAVRNSLKREPKGKRFNSKTFCEATERFMTELKGAARVPHMGTGPLEDFELSSQCESSVKAAFGGKDKLDSVSVPDFWYAMCMNQDCAHFLPSRTKWCDVKRQPTHSVTVCDEAHKFATDEVSVAAPHKMDAEDVCSVYGEFVKEMGIDVKAYNHVMHGDAEPEIEQAPKDPAKALINSQVVGGEVSPFRDDEGHPIQPIRSERDSAPRYGVFVAMVVAMIASARC